MKSIGHCNISQVTWILDSPVSNSGRLKTLMRETAEANGWPWDIQLSLNPDAVLKTSEAIVVTSDSVILDHCPQWCNLAMDVVRAKVPSAWIIDWLWNVRCNN